MDKRLIHAVAGSGKTREIIESLNPQKKNLLITYTENNQRVLKERILKRFGYMPEHTHVFGLFEFLYSFCLVPYCEERLLGINFDYKPVSQYDNNSIDSNYRVIHNRLSKAINEGILVINRKKISFDNSYLERIDKFFECIYIDECQDFESYDFDWMLNLSRLQAKVILLGDYYQKTFSTSRNGNKGNAIHSSYSNWSKAISKSGFEIDTGKLAKSWRCPKYICDFIVQNLDIQIVSEKQVNNYAEVKFIDTQDEIDKIMKEDSIIKLFYQKASSYECNGCNWGESKGTEYDKVCVVLNKTVMEKYSNNKLSELATTTKSKFYVACTRSKEALYFIPESKVKAHKVKTTE